MATISRTSKAQFPVGRKRRPSSVLGYAFVVSVAACPALQAQSVSTDQADKALAQAFDAITETPIASIALGIIESGVQGPSSPDAILARLNAIDSMLQSLNARITIVQERLEQLQASYIHKSNDDRMLDLLRIRLDLAKIVAELKQRAATPTERHDYGLNAKEDADYLLDGFGVGGADKQDWLWTDDKGPNQSVRDRFMVYPAFEVYTLSLFTWLAAIDNDSSKPTAAEAAALDAELNRHAAFLRQSAGYTELTGQPVTLRDNLLAAAFCRLRATATFSDRAGNCPFTTECVDTMADTTTEAGTTIIQVQPAKVGTLCTTAPFQSLSLPGEAALRAQYGTALMDALANELTRRGNFVETFANFVETQLFSASGGPVVVPGKVTVNARPAVPRCMPIVGGCSYGVTLSAATAWKVTNAMPHATGGGVNGPMLIQTYAAGLCLDVPGGRPTPGAPVILSDCKGSASQIWTMKSTDNVRFTLQAASVNLCAGLVPQAKPSKFLLTSLSASLALQACNGSPEQLFSETDGKFVAPR